MYSLPFFISKQSVTLVLCLCSLWSVVIAQVPQSPRKPSQDEVVRVFTDLVQTDVMVFDKQGRFVKGLGKENFELRIDGKVKPIQSFEQITAGSDEEAQLAAARGSVELTAKSVVPLDRGRIIYFYIDDFHMDPAGVNAARKVISRFVQNDMGQNDQVAISSATGQIGFLQQLTGNRAVLKAALERLSPRSYSVRDFDRPPMSEYQAMLIERMDTDVLDVFIAETMRENPGLSREMAAGMVQSRARAIETQADMLAKNTLLGLEGLVRSAKAVSGRKVLFLLSNGFLIENRRGDARERLRQVTSAAAKSGVVIYSLDTRGLTSGLPDAGTDVVFDPSGRLQTAGLGELTATQDGLNALAVDTGGRAILNTNDLSKGVAPAVTESSSYYLLAWKPDSTEGQKPRFRKIEVSVVDRPDLQVRVRRGYFDIDPTPPAATANANKSSDPKKTVVTQLRQAIVAAYPQTDIPVSVGLNYYDVPEKGLTLSTAIGIPGEFLTFGDHDGKIQAIVDVAGVFYNDRGHPVKDFTERIVTTAPSFESSKEFDRELIYSYPANLGPGIYQIRVAARDEKTGRIGAVHEWVQIPDLSNKQLATSSLLVGERKQSAVTVTNQTSTAIPLSTNHRFEPDSMLRLLLVTYNAALSPTDQKPDLAVQVQLLRDQQPVVTTTLRKVSIDGLKDMTHIPYAAEMSLNDLKAGRYILQVSIIDKIAKQSVTQQTHVDIY